MVENFKAMEDKWDRARSKLSRAKPDWLQNMLCLADWYLKHEPHKALAISIHRSHHEPLFDHPEQSLLHHKHCWAHASQYWTLYTTQARSTVLKVINSPIEFMAACARSLNHLNNPGWESQNILIIINVAYGWSSTYNLLPAVHRCSTMTKSRTRLITV